MLYIIPTPIGNREDITLRALRLFKELNIFLCEDTRTFQQLLSLYDLNARDKKLHALTSYTDERRLSNFVELIRNQDVGLVSESGTPGLSDPGKSIVKLCRDCQLPFEVLPGANALVPSIVWAPFDTSDIRFMGFLPTKKGRQTAIKEAIASDIPVFFYESVHRFQKLLEELKTLEFAGTIYVCRELSKKFEQKVAGTVDELLAQTQSGQIPTKGEFVVGVKK